MKTPRTPLHAWLGRKLGLKAGREPSPRIIAEYQLAKLRQTIDFAREQSPFHRERLAALSSGFPERLEDIAQLPFTDAADLRQHHLAMLCVSQDQVARVVTLHTSGTTAEPKRVYFSDSDLELSLDFFHHGMSSMVEPGACVLILLPGSTPDSVGDLLARALNRMQVRGVVHGPIANLEAVIETAISFQPDCLVGIPVQVLAMAEQPKAERLRGVVRSVLLTTDYVPRAIAQRIRQAWDCEVFEHYGMTEIGLGGGVDCRAHAGYHLRGADLYYEVVDPNSGSPLAMGEQGELVVTTLTRQAMPLLRYRTGDWGRLLPMEDCPCRGVTPRLERVPGRLDNRLKLSDGDWLPMRRLDEALFALPGLLDFRVSLFREGQMQRLDLTVQAASGAPADLAQEVKRATSQVPGLEQKLAAGILRLGSMEVRTTAWISDGSTKRTVNHL